MTIVFAATHFEEQFFDKGWFRILCAPIVDESLRRDRPKIVPTIFGTDGSELIPCFSFLVDHGAGKFGDIAIDITAATLDVYRVHCVFKFTHKVFTLGKACLWRELHVGSN